MKDLKNENTIMPANKLLLVNIDDSELNDLEDLLTTDISKDSIEYNNARRKRLLNLWGKLVREFDDVTDIKDYEIRDLLDKYTNDIYASDPVMMSNSGGYSIEDMIEFSLITIAHSKKNEIDN